MQRTLVLIKPDALEREMVGEILGRIERKGLKIVGLKMLRLSTDVLELHYKHLLDRDFFPEIQRFMTALPFTVSSPASWLRVDVPWEPVPEGRVINMPANSIQRSSMTNRSY